jgi:hypothetical protein
MEGVSIHVIPLKLATRNQRQRSSSKEAKRAGNSRAGATFSCLLPLTVSTVRALEVSW